MEHTTLKHRAADEFELIEAPDILALSKQQKEHQVAQSLSTVVKDDKEIDTVKLEPNVSIPTIGENFSIQIEHNYINGVSPALGLMNADDNLPEE